MLNALRSSTLGIWISKLKAADIHRILSQTLLCEHDLSFLFAKRMRVCRLYINLLVRWLFKKKKIDLKLLSGVLKYAKETSGLQNLVQAGRPL